MNKISVTIEGASWGDVIDQMEQFVGRGEVLTMPAPVVNNALYELAGVPMPEEPPHVAAAFPPFAAAQSWTPGECPVHHKPFKDGAYGPFCSAQGGNGPLNKKGYCDLKPGMIYNGKAIPQLAVSA